MQRLGAAALLFGLLMAPILPAQAGPVSTADVRAMALNMYHEARGEGEIGMLAVGWVVLNRMADKAYPGTVAQVIYQGCQFSWVCDGRSDQPREGRSWRKALSLAVALLTAAGTDPTRGALWYHADWVRNPGFGSGVSVVTRIGRHVFYTRTREPGPRLLFASR